MRACARAELQCGPSARPDSPRIDRDATTDLPPLSWPQEWIWSSYQKHAHSRFYNSSIALRLAGNLDVAALEASIAGILERHSILRTTIRVGECGARQRIHALPVHHKLQRIDLPGDRERKQALKEYVTAPFDLTNGPLIRFALSKLGDAEHVFAVGCHHIAFDGWSAGILLDELTALYSAYTSGARCTLPDLPIQYSDFSTANRVAVAAGELKRLRQFWKTQLHRLAPCVELATDKQRPSKFSFRGETAEFALDAGVYAGLGAAARRNGTTVQIVLLTAFMLLIRRVSKGDDIFVRCVVSGRDRPETEQLIGLFMQSVIVRARIASDASSQETLAQVTENFCAALEHWQIPSVHLEEIVGPKPDDSYFSRVSLAFNHHNYRRGRPTLPNLAVDLMDELGEATGTEARLDLVLHTVDTGRSLRTLFVYYADIFSAARIAGLAQMYQRIVGELCSATSTV